MSEDDVSGARKPTFSQLYGFKEYPTAIQHQALDERARVDLWNLIERVLLNIADNKRPLVPGEAVWTEHLGQITSGYSNSRYRDKLQHIVFDGEWYDVYDLLQALVQMTEHRYRGPFSDAINDVLALNRADHRVVDAHVVPITNEAELASIAKAVDSPLTNASAHIKRALALFASRENPNFAKAIQEAMSAAEAAAQTLAGLQGVTLGRALDSVQRENPTLTHPALIKGWKELYRFTSDSGGVRHALHEGTAPLEAAQDLAQYFIISCSAFVNLVAAIKAGDR